MNVYNHGTIDIKDNLQVNTNSILYNSGTVKVKGTLSAESNGLKEGDVQSIIVNANEIECTDVVVNGGAVKNDFKWTVSGTTKINSNNSGWINTDHWKTGNYAYVAGSENVINSCYLWVTNDFEMNISSVKGSFKINSGGGVLASNFYGGRDSSTGAVSGPFKIEMAENAVFVMMLSSSQGVARLIMINMLMESLAPPKADMPCSKPRILSEKRRLPIPGVL